MVDTRRMKAGFSGVIGFLQLAVAVVLLSSASNALAQSPDAASRSRACQENLVKIDGAKEQWALENNKKTGDAAPALADLVGEKNYLRRTPVCPDGGTYTLNVIGADPTCSIGGDHSIAIIEKRQALVTTCRDHLTYVESAKQRCAMDRNLGAGAEIKVEDLVGPDKYGLTQEMLVCPDGGTYTLNPIGKFPTCSIGKTHSLEVIPEFIRAKGCVENLAKLEGAMQQYALEHNLAKGSPVSMKDLVGPDKYLKWMPICLDHGTYTVTPVGTSPNCSVGGAHSLAELRAQRCQQNLAMIDGATEQYALDHKLSMGAKVTMDDLVGQDKYIRRMPKCPDGGTYTVSPVGTDPTCSIGGSHSLSKPK